MAEVASAFVSLMPSAKGFGSKLNSQVGPEIDKAGKRGGLSFGKLFAVGAALGLGAKAFSFLGDSLAEATDAQVIGARTENVIKKMGGAANVSAQQVGDLAAAISNKTGIDDEAIQAGQNLLLTFGNIRNEAGKGNDIFNQTSQLMTDMSAAMGTDAKGSAIQLGKALNDPVKGISALSRVGVSFTQGQKDQIAALVETGDTMGAQKVILGELEKQFGGAAEAMTTPAEKAKVAFGNLQEELGTAVLPAFNNLASGAAKGLASITDAFKKDGLGGVASLIGQKIVAALPVIKTKLLEWGAAFVDWIQVAGPPMLAKLGGLIAAFTAWVYTVAYPKIAAALVRWGKAFVEWIGPQIPPMLTKLGQLGARLFSWVLDVGRPRLFAALKKWGDGFVEWIGPKIGPMLAAAGKLLGKLLGWILGTGLPKLLGAMLEMGVALVKWIAPQIPKAVAGLLGLVGKLAGWVIGTGLPMLADKLQTMGTKAFEAFRAAASKKLTEAIDYVKGIPGKIVAVFTGAGTMLYNAGSQLMSGLAAGIRDKITDAINAVKAGLSKIKGMLPGSPIKWGPLKNWNNGGAGKRLMDLVSTGIQKATPKTVKAARSAFDKIQSSLEATRDNLSSTLDGLKGDFDSIASTVASAFAGNLFDVSASVNEAGEVTSTVGQNFIAGLTAKKGELTGLLASFKTLQGWGIDPAFLTQLFSSGNGALITELAGMSQADALGTANLFGDVTNLGAQLGTAVAQNDPVADRIDETNRLLSVAVEQLAYLGSDIGKELNQAASKAQRDKKNRGKGRGKK